MESHFLGHRKRLKQRFVANPSSLADYELLELTLFWAVARKDVKPIAKELLQNFHSIANIVYSTEDKFLYLGQIGEKIAFNYLLIRELLNRTLQSKILAKNILASWGAVIEYLKTSMGHNKTEQFRVLFLNKKNILIADELQEVGTVDQTPVYPREILKRALFHEASAIILVHNHPSGTSEPSKADIQLTNKILEACKAINISLHDHIIVAKDGFYSFKSNLLL
ncbi:MAG: DNA repair protein RadC [Rickettsiaceae bacterium]|nr:DNA repair protein RadC [Rickettsiaceae bacterium]